MGKQLTFATLGPEGTNHDIVTRRYLEYHGIAAQVVLTPTFDQALDLMATGGADHMVQVAVHPDCARTVADAHFRHGIHVIDTFISPSRDLAVLTRSDIAHPQTLGLQAATRDYADLGAWPRHILMPSTVDVANALLSGQIDSGITFAQLVADHPGRFRMDQSVGSVDDPWLVFGKRRVSDGGIIAWRDSPGFRMIRAD